MDDFLGDVGVMFDTMHSRDILDIHVSEGIDVSLKCIDELPGHIQSGQHLWPAALDLSKYLCEQFTPLLPTPVLELGAGCGLTGIVAAKLGAKNVCLTDYDPGSCSLLRENITLNDLECICSVEQLTWGEPFNPACTTATFPPGKESCEQDCTLAPSPSSMTPTFNLVIGADLLYCMEIVAPLFLTVSQTLTPGDGCSFILASSFYPGEDILDEVDRCVEKGGLLLVFDSWSDHSTLATAAPRGQQPGQLPSCESYRPNDECSNDVGGGTSNTKKNARHDLDESQKRVAKRIQRWEKL